MILGGRLLPAAEREGQFAPGRRPGTVVQVDPHPVPLLADAATYNRLSTSKRGSSLLATSSGHDPPCGRLVVKFHRPIRLYAKE